MDWNDNQKQLVWWEKYTDLKWVVNKSTFSLVDWAFTLEAALSDFS